MKNLLTFFLSLILIASCKDTPAEVDETPEQAEELTMNETIERSIIAQLEIPATEKYTIDIKTNRLNDDEFVDAIAMVNRKEFTIQKSKDNNRQEADEKIGYFGNHNHIFFYDGMTGEVTRPIAIPSSALIPLKLEFQNIQTEGYYDFTVDARVGESRWRNFYTIKNGAPKLVFQWNIQTLDDNGKLKTMHIKYDKGSYSAAKDILIYEAKVLSKIPEDLNSDYELKTEEKGELIHRFFYNPNQGKYFTNK